MLAHSFLCSTPSCREEGQEPTTRPGFLISLTSLLVAEPQAIARTQGRPRQRSEAGQDSVSITFSPPEVSNKGLWSFGHRAILSEGQVEEVLENSAQLPRTLSVSQHNSRGSTKQIHSFTQSHTKLTFILFFSPQVGSESSEFLPSQFARQPIGAADRFPPLLNIQTCALSLYSDVWRLYRIGSRVVCCRGADGRDDGGADSESGVG